MFAVGKCRTQYCIHSNMSSLLPPDYDNNYYDLAQTLRKRITEMKIKIDRQLRLLALLKENVKDQVTNMQRLEVRGHNRDKKTESRL